MDHFPKLLLLTISLISISFPAPSSSYTHSFSSSSSSSSIYDLLQFHGLPIGLLPKGVTNFTIDLSTNRFEANLQQPCDAHFETHVRYHSIVSGTLSYGRIAGLSGVTAQDLFLWFEVKNIRVDVPSSGLIYFDVGVVDKQFSLSFFETPRDCAATVSDLRTDDTVLFNDHGKIAQLQSGEFVNELDQGDVGRNVS